MPEMRRGYWAVVPAAVRYDERLTERAKLIYAEISALAEADGYCWATDKYFADLYGVNARTVSRALHDLKDAGYIQVDMSSNNKGVERHIFCGVFNVSSVSSRGIDKNVGTDKNVDTGIDKNVRTPRPTQFNTNNKSKNNNPLPPELMTMVTELAGENEDLIRGLLAMAELRQSKHRPYTTGRQLTLLFGKLRKLSGGDEAVMCRMLDKAVEHGWDSVYALKTDDLPAPAGRVVEAQDVIDWAPGMKLE